MIGFIGFGKMGSALAKGAVASKVLRAKDVVAYDHGREAQAALKKMGGRFAKNGAEVVKKANIIFLCVKPQSMRDALTPIALERTGLSLSKKCFVSIAAGITIKSLESWIGEKAAVFRVMPNTPALLSAGMSAIAKGRYGTSAQERSIKKILSSVGSVVSLNEKFMDTVTAVSGSGPAYVFYLAEAMTEGAVKCGMTPALARQFVRQTVFGAGKMLAQLAEPADILRRNVTSPGGTTAAAIGVFDQEDLKHIVHEAIRSAARRSAQLAKS